MKLFSNVSPTCEKDGEIGSALCDLLIFEPVQGNLEEASDDQDFSSFAGTEPGGSDLTGGDCRLTDVDD